MGVSGSAKCMKYLLFIFNFFFFLLGCVLIGIGVWAEVTLGPYVQLTDVDYITGPRIVMAVGVAVAVISFFGCCGAYKENKCMLSLYLTLLIILLALEIAAAVLAYQKRDEIKDQLKNDIQKKIKEYPHGNLKKPLDDLQSKLKCCGAFNYTDWKINTGFKNDSAVPDSCCKTVKQDCGRVTSDTNIYREGCYTKLQDLIEENLKPTAALAITMLVIEILGVIFALVLICRID